MEAGPTRPADANVGSKSRLLSLLQSRWTLAVLILIVVIIHILYLMVYVVLKPQSFHTPLSKKCDEEHDYLAEDIGDIKYLSDGSLETEDGTIFPANSFYESENKTKGCPCLYKTCVRKCCPLYQRFISYTNLTCASDNTTVLLADLIPNVYSKLQKDQPIVSIEDRTVNASEIHVLRETGCNEEGQYALGHRFESIREKAFLISDGTLLTESLLYIDLNGYCLESVVGKNILVHVKCTQNTFVRDIYERNKVAHYILFVLMCLSLSFLIATLIVYSCLPALRNLHGKLLMCHTASILGYYFSLMLVELYPIVGSFCIQIFLVARTTWLTAACFELWKTFSGKLKHRRPSSVNDVEMKKFFLYSLFGWGVPIISIILSALVGVVPDRSDSCHRPRFRDDPCFFTVKRTFLLLITFPMFLMVSTNLVMFLFTLINMRNHFKAIKNLPTNISRSVVRERFWLYVRLSLLMGVNWFVMEIFYIEDLKILTIRAMFYFAVFYVLAQGILQFVILIFCNRRVLNLVIDKWFYSITPSQSSS